MASPIETIIGQFGMLEKNGFTPEDEPHTQSAFQTYERFAEKKGAEAPFFVGCKQKTDYLPRPLTASCEIGCESRAVTGTASREFSKSTPWALDVSITDVPTTM